MIFSIEGIAQYKNVYSKDAWEERDKWQKPEQIIEKLNLKEGSRVADIGCHEGYMTLKLAEKVGFHGRVYAVDINEDKLRLLRENLKEANLKERVNVVKGEFDNPKLPVNTMDAVLIIDTYHEIYPYEQVLKKIYLSMKKGGLFVLVEPIAEERRQLNRKAQTLRHELSLHYAEKELKDAGFHILKTIDPFVDRTEIKGDKMWMIVAEK